MLRSYEILFFLGNGDTKHVAELQTDLKADKVTSNEIFGSRQQYVVLSHVEHTYYITINTIKSDFREYKEAR